MNALWANRKARVGLILVGTMTALASFGWFAYDAPMHPIRWARFWARPMGSFGLAPPWRAKMSGPDALRCGAHHLLVRMHWLGGHLAEHPLGVTAGFYGGRVDQALNVVINIFLLIPGLPLMIVLAALVQQGTSAISGPVAIALVLVFTGWPWGARVLRSQAMTLAQRPFIEAPPTGRPPSPSSFFICSRIWPRSWAPPSSVQLPMRWVRRSGWSFSGLVTQVL